LSAFLAPMKYAREHLPGTAADIEYLDSTSLRDRQSVVNSVAELMRWVNHVPDGASLPRARATGDQPLMAHTCASAIRSARGRHISGSLNL
jgi:hypothetical protein